MLAQVLLSQEVAQQSTSLFPLLLKAIWGRVAARELPAPEGELSASDELISSSLPHHPPVSHGAGRERSLRGRLSWEAVQGGLGAAPCGGWGGGTGRGCAHVQVPTRALSLFLCSSSGGLSACWVNGPQMGGLAQWKSQVSECQGTLETSVARTSPLSVKSRALNVRIRVHVG